MFLRNALVCNPESAALRLRLAMLFNELDRFGGTIALLSAAVRLEFEELLVQSAAYFARSAPGDADP